VQLLGGHEIYINGKDEYHQKGNDNGIDNVLPDQVPALQGGIDGCCDIKVKFLEILVRSYELASGSGIP
jgi:hypothetical protein